MLIKRQYLKKFLQYEAKNGSTHRKMVLYFYQENWVIEFGECCGFDAGPWFIIFGPNCQLMLLRMHPQTLTFFIAFNCVLGNHWSIRLNVRTPNTYSSFISNSKGALDTPLTIFPIWFSPGVNELCTKPTVPADFFFRHESFFCMYLKTMTFA